ncbi:MAG: type IV pilus assembly protein PilM [Kiritimatiellia bacterium]
MFDNDRLIAVDLGASKIALAEFRIGKGGVPTLLHYGISPIEGDSGNEGERLGFIVTAIQDQMRALAIKPGPMMLSVSGQVVFPRFVKLPPVGRDKLSQIIQYEAEQNVPFPIDEVVWDYQLIGEAEDELNVMLVAAKIENIKRLTDCVQAADLEPDVVDVAPMALLNAVRHTRSDDGCVMILDIGARSSNLIFMEADHVFTRSIPVAGNTITQELMKSFDVSYEEAEKIKLEQGFVSFGGVTAAGESETAEQASKIIRSVLTRLHAEVNRSINFYRSQQGGSAPDLVLLTGGSSMLAHVDTFFQDKLRVPVEYFNPFDAVEIGPNVDVEALNQDIQSMGEVVGLALRRGGHALVEINLMPPDLVARKTFRRRKPFFIVSGIAVVLTLIGWWGYFTIAGSALAERTQRLDGAVRDLRQVQRQLEQVTNDRQVSESQLDTLTEQVALRARWIELLQVIGSALQEGMWISAIEPQIQDRRVTGVHVTVQGFSDKLEDTAQGTAAERLRDRLRASPFFRAESEIVREMGVGSYRREIVLRLDLEQAIPTH